MNRCRNCGEEIPECDRGNGVTDTCSADCTAQLQQKENTFGINETIEKEQKRAVDALHRAVDKARGGYRIKGDTIMKTKNLTAGEAVDAMLEGYHVIDADGHEVHDYAQICTLDGLAPFSIKEEKPKYPEFEPIEGRVTHVGVGVATKNRIQGQDSKAQERLDNLKDEQIVMLVPYGSVVFTKEQFEGFRLKMKDVARNYLAVREQELDGKYIRYDDLDYYIDEAFDEASKKGSKND